MVPDTTGTLLVQVALYDLPREPGAPEYSVWKLPVVAWRCNAGPYGWAEPITIDSTDGANTTSFLQLTDKFGGTRFLMPGLTSFGTEREAIEEALQELRARRDRERERAEKGKP